MAPEIIKTYREHLPALRFIGKRYTNADRAGGGYGHKWGEWFGNGWFAPLESLGEPAGIENGYLGFMRASADAFEYWIGMFLPVGTAVPDGYDSFDLEESDVAVCWIRGKDGPALYRMDEPCMAAFQKNGMGNAKLDSENRAYFFERYNCPRFTTPDADGNVILDLGMYIC